MPNKDLEITQTLKTTDSLIFSHHWYDGKAGDIEVSGSYSLGGSPHVYIDVKHIPTDHKETYVLSIAEISQQAAEHFLGRMNDDDDDIAKHVPQAE